MTEPTLEVISLVPSADGWRTVFTSGGGANIVPLVCWPCSARRLPGPHRNPTEDAASAAAQGLRGDSRAWNIEDVAVYQQVASI